MICASFAVICFSSCWTVLHDPSWILLNYVLQTILLTPVCTWISYDVRVRGTHPFRIEDFRFREEREKSFPPKMQFQLFFPRTTSGSLAGARARCSVRGTAKNCSRDGRK